LRKPDEAAENPVGLQKNGEAAKVQITGLQVLALKVQALRLRALPPKAYIFLAAGCSTDRA